MTTPDELAGLSLTGESPDGGGDEIFRSLAILARALHVKDAQLQPALQAIVSAAVGTVSAAQHAGVILVVRGELVPQAATGRPALLLDQLQQKLSDGPCIDAAVRQAVVRIDDMSRETRWPRFAAEAVSTSVRSMLCLPLWVHERCLGTLSLYSDRAGVFTGHDEQVTALFATLAAIALAEAQRTDQLHAALASRDVIGQAKGILMERQKITGEAAFGCLSRASQNLNLKLSAVARHLVTTGELPGTPRPER
ncbi:MAG TPA: GAF and ANTAR domain-containing protein [Trebonia sp.]|nr:GAF and ANTAR domain-containing protein [Trebonia sp.]